MVRMVQSLRALVALPRQAASRQREVHDQLSAVIDPRDPRGWVFSSVAALGASIASALPTRAHPYLISDAAPRQDTFMGAALPPPPDRASAIVEAVFLAFAARQCLRALDGELPDQPLATILDRRGAARSHPSDLRYAAFLLDGVVWVAELGPERLSPDALGARLDELVRALASPAGSSLRRLSSADASSTPFVCVCVDEGEPAYLRHSARHAWRGGLGPWLGLGRARELRAVATSHFALDGYGHAWLTADVLDAAAALSLRYRAALCASVLSAARDASARRTLLAPPPPRRAAPREFPPPLGIATRAIPSPSPRVTPLAYRLGQLLARRLPARPSAAPPTVFIPVAPGLRSDPLRVRRRVSAVVVAVHREGGGPEPYARFADRAASAFAAEAAGRGLHGTLHRAASGLPLPLRWKRELIGNYRPRGLGELPAALGGRACLSSIRMRERRLPPLVAVSCPVLLPSAEDPVGGCLLTIVDDGHQATITASGAGLAGTDAEAAALLEELLQE